MSFGILDYLKQSFIHPTKTGSVAPSSDKLCELLTDTAGLQSASTVIEFGPGTGVLTERILNKISNNTTFFALEINPRFAAATRLRCPDATVYNDSAENAKLHLQNHGVDGCDCIISALPWSVFTPGLQDRLLSTIWDILEPGGRLLTVAYFHAQVFPSAQRFKNKLYEKFPTVTKTEIVWSNLPPAFVYCAQK